METKSYSDKFEQLERMGKLDFPEEFQSVRKEAMRKFAASGFPTTGDELWKYTSLESLKKTNFEIPSANPSALSSSETPPFLFEANGWNRLVFIDGFFCHEASILQGDAAAFTVKNLASLTEEEKDLIEHELLLFKNDQDQPLTALNTALFQDGFYIFLKKNQRIETPLLILHLSSEQKAPIMNTERNMIILGEDSSCTIVQCFAGIGNAGGYFKNGVTEAVLKEGARLHYYQLQNESKNAYHIQTHRIRQARNSRFVFNGFSYGAALARSNFNVSLEDEGVESELNALAMTTDGQHADHCTFVDHLKPHGTSRQLFKSVVSGKSNYVFSGKVLVHQDAQKTNAQQTNKNLLLGDHAVVDTKPQLEIFADDVKCSHGAATGQLEEDFIFYLKSRGIAEAEAKKILTFGFANEVIEQVELKPLRDHLHELTAAFFND